MLQLSHANIGVAVIRIIIAALTSLVKAGDAARIPRTSTPSNAGMDNASVI